MQWYKSASLLLNKQYIWGFHTFLCTNKPNQTLLLYAIVRAINIYKLIY